ncbi:4'-phosphopantetheinyl transferase family protein [Mediterraneibacter gnavus]|uniref:4'-phosphopantetheinyl transferase family protein n=1 Tax=Mediterraneibacter gnavus TaxID=33038 RepID=UPI001D04BFF9|nr:4'-phosphopantetheinyl transferase superfamily protein [Mediterraneibacter gnavus]MCB5458826.1 4'-phosphopantetheinyl transferase superfamily protein [Mediterraneibacter gnavus]
MVRLYAINVQESMRENNFKELLLYITNEKANRILKFRYIADAYRTMLGELLIRYAVYQKSGCDNDEIIISNKGKPYLIYPKGIFFNISHSGNWVVGATADAPLGIDIEYIKSERNYKEIMYRFYTSSERQYIMSAESEHVQRERFYQIWTLKESYIKADGRGLNIPLNSFDVVSKRDNQYLVENSLQNKYKKFSVKWKDSYFVSVHSLDNEICKKIQTLSVKKIKEDFKFH